MAKLIYATICSLDGYIAEPGKSDWAMPDEEVHQFVNDLERTIGTYLYGRRMYEMMVFWETASAAPDEPPVFHDYAEIWRASDKVVYSRTLQEVSSARTRIEREFDPDAVRRLKQSADGRHRDRRPRARRPGDRRGPGRRVPPLPLPGRRRSRQTRPAGHAPRPTRAPRRAPIHQRRRPSPLPRDRLDHSSSIRATFPFVRFSASP